jgi:hypothetical protein
MIRKYMNPLIVSALASFGVLAATPSFAAGENCVMAIDYAGLPAATLDRLYKDIHDANDWNVIRDSMKCAQSLTYSKLPDSVVDQLAKGKAPVIDMAPTMQLNSPNYAVLSDEEVRRFGGW